MEWFSELSVLSQCMIIAFLFVIILYINKKSN